MCSGLCLAHFRLFPLSPPPSVCMFAVLIWYCDVGGDELRGAALLELVQPGRYQGHREGLQVRDLEQSCKVFGFLLLKRMRGE